MNLIIMSKKLQESSFEIPPNIILPIITCTENVCSGIKSSSLNRSAIQVKSGLCINCEKNNYCIWKEDKKVSCEHYQ